MSSLSVALFTDSFDEANGVATFCQQFPIDFEFRCDPLLSLYKNWVTDQLRLFRADLVHITGPGDFGILGFWAAHSLGIPLVASWHTNLHEYAGRRLDRFFSRLPTAWRSRIVRLGEDLSVDALMLFYRLPRFTLAPEESVIRLLRDRTHRPAYFLPHGVDTDFFSPTRRNRRTDPFCIGYVGRLTPEKSVRLFAELENRLLAAGQRDFRLVLIGEGSEKGWLTQNLQSAELPGILRGEVLAEAFANMDVFVFPSQTDTFGLVLLEAMASGVPVVVHPETALRVRVEHGRTVFVAEDAAGFAESVLRLMDSEALRRKMSCAARRFACSKAWSGVFQQIYRTYEIGLEECGGAK